MRVEENKFKSPFYYLFATNCVISLLCNKCFNKEEVNKYKKLEERYYESLNYSTVFLKLSSHFNQEIQLINEKEMKK